MATALLLTLGNEMNLGTAKGGAGGFKIGALLKTTQTKTNQGVTLLEYLIETVRKRVKCAREAQPAPPSFGGGGGGAPPSAGRSGSGGATCRRLSSDNLDVLALPTELTPCQVSRTLETQKKGLRLHEIFRMDTRRRMTAQASRNEARVLLWFWRGR